MHEREQKHKDIEMYGDEKSFMKKSDKIAEKRDKNALKILLARSTEKCWRLEW